MIQYYILFKSAQIFTVCFWWAELVKKNFTLISYNYWQHALFSFFIHTWTCHLRLVIALSESVSVQNGPHWRAEGSERARRWWWGQGAGRRVVESANRVFLTSRSLDREEMKSLQAALQKQLDEANERAEKQQATVRRRRPDHQHPVSP